MVDREDSGGYHQEEDEMINDEEEAKADAAALAVFPKRMKAVLKFGYDEGFKDHLAAKGETFDGYIESVFNMMQVYWRHPSLTTEVIFEVTECSNILIYFHGIIMCYENKNSFKSYFFATYRSKMSHCTKLASYGTQEVWDTFRKKLKRQN